MSAQTGLFVHPDSLFVGIGTTLPRTQLNLTNTGAAADASVITIGGGGTSSSIGIDFTPQTGRSGGAAAKIRAVGDGSGNASLVFATATGGSSSAAVDRVVVDANGNVGIGTTVPLSGLHVRANTASAGCVIDQAGTGGILDIRDAGVSKVIVDAVGNVGIGVANPMKALDVNGTIQANNITIYDPSKLPGFNSTGDTLYPSKIVFGNAYSPVIKVAYPNNSYWDNTELQFLTSGINSQTDSQQPRMVIKGLIGYVGIGTTNPTEKLHVDGNIRASGRILLPLATGYIPSIHFGTASTYTDDNIYQLLFGGSAVTGLGLYSSTKGVFSKQGIGFHISSLEEFSIKSTGWDNLFGIEGNSGNAYIKGNVGIGMTTPNAKLVIYGEGQSSVTTFNTFGANGCSINIRDNGGAFGNGGALIFGAGQGNFAAIKGILTDGTTNTLGNLNFYTRNAANDATLTSRMTIAGWGSVGIGTTIPLSKLHVEGIVKTQNPAFSGTRTAGDLPAGSVVAMNQVFVNVGNCYDTTSGRFTASVSGVYHASIMGMTASTSTIWLQILKNGSATNIFNPYSTSNNGAHTHVSGSTLIYLNAGDYLQMYIVFGTLYAQGNAHNQFSVFLVG